MPSLPPKKCRSSRANDSFLTLLKDHRRDEKLSHERRQFSLSSSDSDDEDLDGLYSSGTSAKDNLEALVGKEDAQGMRQILEQDGQTCTDDDELHGFTFWDRGAPGTGHVRNVLTWLCYWLTSILSTVDSCQGPKRRAHRSFPYL